MSVPVLRRIMLAATLTLFVGSLPARGQSKQPCLELAVKNVSPGNSITVISTDGLKISGRLKSIDLNRSLVTILQADSLVAKLFHKIDARFVCPILNGFIWVLALWTVDSDQANFFAVLQDECIAVNNVIYAACLLSSAESKKVRQLWLGLLAFSHISLRRQSLSRQCLLFSHSSLYLSSVFTAR